MNEDQKRFLLDGSYGWSIVRLSIKLVCLIILNHTSIYESEITNPMSSPKLSLERVLDPVSPVQFFDEYWEQKPLHLSRDDTSHYGDLLSLESLDSLLAQGHDEGMSISLSELDENGNADVQEFGGNRPANHDLIYSSFAEGATVRTRDMERYLDLGQQFTADLEKWTSAPVQINMYLTPQKSKGFNTHQDGHDVMILQTAGKKHWRVYEDPLELPSDRVVDGRDDLFNTRPQNRTVPAEPVPDDLTPSLDVTLEPGDFLYIPRGFYHDARTTGDLSMHLTVGIYVLTWHDATVKALASLFEERPRLRQALPPGFATGNAGESELQERTEEIIQEIREHLDAETLRKAVDEIGHRFVESRRSPFHGYFQDIDRMQKGLEPEEEVQVRPEISYRMTAYDGKIHLTFNGRNVKLPGESAPALKFMKDHGTFSAAEMPSELGVENNFRIIQHLMKHGFLTFADNGAE